MTEQKLASNNSEKNANSNPIMRFVNSKIGLLITGFVFTTLCGAIINNIYSKSMWNREQEQIMLTRLLNKHENLLEEISILMGARIYRLERVLWALEIPFNNLELNEEVHKRIMDRWDEYYAKVIEWNEKFRSYYVKVRYLAGEDLAKKLYISEKESSDPSSTTVYGKLVNAHYAVKNLRDYIISGTVPDSMLYFIAKSKVEEAYTAIDNFLIEMYFILDMRAKSCKPQNIH
jgi:hypothetical protein